MTVIKESANRPVKPLMMKQFVQRSTIFASLAAIVLQDMYGKIILVFNHPAVEIVSVTFSHIFSMSAMTKAISLSTEIVCM